MYDYAARYYEPKTGRFSTTDPMAEKFYSISPYAYCFNNPVKFVDPDGKIPTIIGKFALGAGIDAVTQVGVSMAKGDDFVTALKNIDVTSVIAAGAISAVTIPGLSTAAKLVVTGTAIAMDALSDHSFKEGTKSVINGTKNLSDAAKDAVLSTVTLGAGNVATSKITKTVQTSVKSDVSAINKLGSGTGNKNIINNTTKDTAIKETKKTGKIVEKVLNNSVDASTSVTEKIISDKLKKK